MTTFVLWGRKRDEAEHEEVMIREDENRAKIAQAERWAKSLGYVHFRISEIDLDTPPDFIGAIAKR